jgi:hypothetical protein
MVGGLSMDGMKLESLAMAKKSNGFQLPSSGDATAEPKNKLKIVDSPKITANVSGTCKFII